MYNASVSVSSSKSRSAIPAKHRPWSVHAEHPLLTQHDHTPPLRYSRYRPRTWSPSAL